MPPPQARTGGPFPVPQAGPMPAAVLATPQPHGSQTLPTSLHTPTEGRSTRIGTESPAPLATNPIVPRAVHTPLGDARPAQREIAAAADSAAVPRTNTTPPDVVRAALALLHSVEGTSASQAAFSFESRAAAAGVILNAAMIPGWPFPSAFARDTPRFEAAALRELGQKLVAMTPEELAEYIAKIGGDHRLLRRIRRFLKQIDGEEGEMAMGFLAMLGAALGQIARALSLPMALAAEEIAQLAGSPEDDGNPLRPGPGGPRRRLRL